MKKIGSFFARALGLFIVQAAVLNGAALAQEAFNVKDHYTKSEHQLVMRDGIKLFTSIYMPKDAAQKHPLLMMRTPYSVAPYGA